MCSELRLSGVLGATRKGTNGPGGSTPAQSREQYACAPSARRVSVHRPPRRAVANPSATSEPGHGRAADIPTLQKKL